MNLHLTSFIRKALRLYTGRTTIGFKFSFTSYNSLISMAPLTSFRRKALRLYTDRTTIGFKFSFTSFISLISMTPLTSSNLI